MVLTEANKHLSCEAAFYRAVVDCCGRIRRKIVRSNVLPITGIPLQIQNVVVWLVAFCEIGCVRAIKLWIYHNKINIGSILLVGRANRWKISMKSSTTVTILPPSETGELARHIVGFVCSNAFTLNLGARSALLCVNMYRMQNRSIQSELCTV